MDQRRVGTGTGVQQGLHRDRVPMFGRQHQRGATVGPGGMDVRAAPHQGHRRRHMAVLGRHQQRRAAICQGGFGFGPVAEQGRHGVGVAMAGRQHQRRPAIRHLRIRVRTAVQQGLDHLVMTARRSQHHGGRAIGQRGFGACAGIEQHLHHGAMAGFGSEQQRAHPQAGAGIDIRAGAQQAQDTPHTAVAHGQQKRNVLERKIIHKVHGLSAQFWVPCGQRRPTARLRAPARRCSCATMPGPMLHRSNHWPPDHRHPESRRPPRTLRLAAAVADRRQRHRPWLAMPVSR